MIKKFLDSGYGAILHRPWVQDSNNEGIIGFWAEDNSEYYIKVPYQLRDMIIEIQNWLHHIYVKVSRIQRNYDTVNHELESFFEGLNFKDD